MIHIKPTIDFERIRQIAFQTWPSTYVNIVPQEQISYMLEKFYNNSILEENYTEKNHLFLMAFQDQKAVGFASFEHFYLEKSITRVHKIYILPEVQGLGIGKKLIQEIETLSLSKACNILNLNVNKFNNAIYFYKKNGFEVIKEEQIQLEFGYIMDDFVMQKSLTL